MGNNVVVLIHTDELSEIENSNSFGRRLADAIRYNQDTVLGFNTQVLPYEHADATQVVLAGQNMLTRLDVSSYGFSARGDARDEIALLHMLAAKYGFNVVSQ